MKEYERKEKEYRKYFDKKAQEANERADRETQHVDPSDRYEKSLKLYYKYITENNSVFNNLINDALYSGKQYEKDITKIVNRALKDVGSEKLKKDTIYQLLPKISRIYKQ